MEGRSVCTLAGTSAEGCKIGLSYRCDRCGVGECSGVEPVGHRLSALIDEPLVGERIASQGCGCAVGATNNHGVSTLVGDNGVEIPPSKQQIVYTPMVHPLAANSERQLPASPGVEDIFRFEVHFAIVTLYSKTWHIGRPIGF